MCVHSTMPSAPEFEHGHRWTGSFSYGHSFRKRRWKDTQESPIIAAPAELALVCGASHIHRRMYVLHCTRLRVHDAHEVDFLHLEVRPRISPGSRHYICFIFYPYLLINPGAIQMLQNNTLWLVPSHRTTPKLVVEQILHTGLVAQ